MWIYKTHFLEDGEFFEYDTFGGQGSMPTQRFFLIWKACWSK